MVQHLIVPGTGGCLWSALAGGVGGLLIGAWLNAVWRDRQEQRKA